MAFALQIALPKQIRSDARYTGRRPKDVLSGTLRLVLMAALGFGQISLWGTYQIKLLNPSTRIAIPENWTTAFKLESKASISCGNMGARANGPIPWTKVAAVAHVRVENFQKVLQFFKQSAGEERW